MLTLFRVLAGEAFPKVLHRAKVGIGQLESLLGHDLEEHLVAVVNGQREISDPDELEENVVVEGGEARRLEIGNADPPLEDAAPTFWCCTIPRISLADDDCVTGDPAPLAAKNVAKRNVQSMRCEGREAERDVSEQLESIDPVGVGMIPAHLSVVDALREFWEG